MNTGEFRDLVLMCKPSSIHSMMTDNGGRVTVALGKEQVVLYAAEVDIHGNLVEWMPDHPFVDRFVYDDMKYMYKNTRPDIECTDTNTFDYRLG